MAIQTGVNVMDISGFTVTRDDNNTLTFSGTYQGNNLWQQVQLNNFPVLISYNPPSTNFSAITDLSYLNSGDLLVDIYYS